MENKKQHMAKAMFEQLAMQAVDYYRDEDELEAKACWDQLVGAAEMYSRLFDLDDMGWYEICVKALNKACEHFKVDVSEFWCQIAEK